MKIVMTLKKMIVLNILFLMATIVGKAQCPTFTVTTNADANGSLPGSVYCPTLQINNSANHILGYYAEFIDLNNAANSFTSYISPSTNSLTFCSATLANGCYFTQLIVTDSTNNSCNQTVYSNTICVTNGAVTCPTVNINSNLVNGVLNDPNGLFQYTINVVPDLPNDELKIYFSGYNGCGSIASYGKDTLYNYPSTNSFNLTSGYYYYNNYEYFDYTSNMGCQGSLPSFTVNATNQQNVVSFFTYAPNNFCYNNYDSINNYNIIAQFCGSTYTPVTISVGWPAPIGTQTYVMNQTSFGQFEFDVLSIAQQYSLTPGNYMIPITLINIYGPPFVYPQNVNDTLFYNYNILPCGNLEGNVYIDTDNSCNQNNSELGHYGLAVLATDYLGQSYPAWTDNIGHYNFYNIPIGTYTLQYVDNGYYNYTVTCANSMPQVVTVTTSSITTKDFAIECSPTFDYSAYWIGITGTTLNGLFPGQTSFARPWFNMNSIYCSNTPSQIKLVLDPCTTLDPTSSTYTYLIAPDAYITSPTGDTAVWNNINPTLFYSYYYNYGLPVTTCTNAQVGDTACFTLIVLPITGDTNPLNNVFTRCQAIGVSYDPNHKDVFPQGTTAMGNISPTTTELRYTINFQNTGSAPAWNIYVLDTLSPNLDASSLKIIQSSHAMQPIMLNNNVVKFNFPNIMLADSSHNEPQSHGQVTYSVKLKPNLPLGSQINNTGYIYFDYNEAIVTNTTKNTLAITQSLFDYSKSNNVVIYPNPSTNNVYIKSNLNIRHYELLDVTGRTVLTRNNISATKEVVLSLHDIDNGTYIINLTDDNNNRFSQKIIKLNVK